MGAPDTGTEAGPCRGPPDRARLRELAREQAAFRRVATLVAEGARPDEVFTAIAYELGGLIGAEATFVARLNHVSRAGGDPEEYVTVVGLYVRVGDQGPGGFRCQ